MTNDGVTLMERDSNPLFLFFASEMKRLREAKGWSQEALGKRIDYSSEMVSKVETCRNRPSREFAVALDNVFPQMGGMFVNIADQAEKSYSVYPLWFQSWVDAEKRATVLRWWEPLLVPGLLQTAEYAEVLFNTWRAVDGTGDIEADVAARLARQDIFGRSTPPSFTAVIDESMLYRCIGNPKVMHDQLLHLVEMSERARITVQILPANIGSHVGLLGAFATASFTDAPGMVYLETHDEGTIIRNPARVERIMVTFDTLRGDALGARDSRDLMRKVAEETWTA